MAAPLPTATLWVPSPAIEVSGGLIGYNYPGGSITESYWNIDATASGVGNGSNIGATGKTAGQLQSPAANTGIYANWNALYWDFGDSTQYPALKADMDGDGTATAAEFGEQRTGRCYTDVNARQAYFRAANSRAGIDAAARRVTDSVIRRFHGGQRGDGAYLRSAERRDGVVLGRWYSGAALAADGSKVQEHL